MAGKTRGISVEEISRSHDALLVVDIDEVVLEFITPLQTLLGENGARLHFDSYKLTGNAKSLATGEALTAPQLETHMRRLYAEQRDRQCLVAGARETLKDLETRADIVFLTAMDPDYHDIRRATLGQLGLDYPMIATERSKGALVAELSQRWNGPVVFVDDLPSNLETVRRSAPQAHLVHIMAHDGFRPHLPPLPRGAHSAKNWTELKTIVLSILGDRPD